MLIHEYDPTKIVRPEALWTMCKDLHLTLMVMGNPPSPEILQYDEHDDQHSSFLIMNDGVHYLVEKVCDTFNVLDITEERPVFGGSEYGVGFLVDVCTESHIETEPNDVADAILDLCQRHQLQYQTF